MSLRENIISVIEPKVSRKWEGNGAISEIPERYYVRDDELIQVAGFLTGLEFPDEFYNVESQKVLTWSKDQNGFIDCCSGELYGAIYYSEDFEGGSLPAIWTVVNGENGWFVGTAAKASGTYGFYSSNNAGATNTYTSVGGALDVSHAYLDVDLPVAANFIYLILDWRCEAEAGFDYANIFDAPTSVTPVLNTEVSGTYLIGASEYNDQSTFNTEQIEIPLGEGGTTRRFIFSFRNDSTVEGQPPMCIDNIKIIYG